MELGLGLDRVVIYIPSSHVLAYLFTVCGGKLRVVWGKNREQRTLLEADSPLPSIPGH